MFLKEFHNDKDGKCHVPLLLELMRRVLDEQFNVSTDLSYESTGLTIALGREAVPHCAE